MKVDFQHNPWDRKVLRLANIFYAKTVGNRADLTESQVRYRIKQAGMSPRLFRSGLSPEAKQLLSEIDHGVASIKATLGRINREVDRSMKSSRRRKATDRKARR